MTSKRPIRPIACICMAVLLCCSAAWASAQPTVADMLRVYYDSANKYDFVEPDTALMYFKKIRNLLNQKELKKYWPADSIQKKWIQVNQSIATCYNIIGQYDTAMVYYETSLKKARERRDTLMILTNISNRAIAYMNCGQQEQALNSYYDVIELAKNNKKYKRQLAASYNNIATFYETHSAVKDFDKALEYRYKYLNIQKERYATEKNKERSLALGYTNLGLLYNKLNQKDSAYHYAQLAIPMQEKIQDLRALGTTLSIIGGLYEKDSLLEEALSIYQKSADYAKLSGYRPVYVERITDVAKIHVRLAEKTASSAQRNSYLEQAVQHATEAFELSNEMGLLFDKNEAIKTLADAYMMQKKYKQATSYLTLCLELSDSLHNKEAADNVYKLENKYISERNQLLQKDKETTEQLMKSRETTLMIVVIASILLLAMLVIIYQRMRMVSRQREEIAEQKELILLQKEEVEAQRDFANKQREEIAEQKELILLQKEEVEAQRDFAAKQRKEIMSSISYAKRIQDAVLPNLPPDLPIFVLYMPRDIVSGDFYWCSQHGDTTLLAVADCTGHGVPGACMSMLGLSYLREISLLQIDNTPAQMLDTMRLKVIAALGQTGSMGEARDGMDITVCKLNNRTGELLFASAYNPLLVVPREGEPYTIKGDRQPIAYSHNPKPFSLQSLQLQPGDAFYMMSDGLKDLFSPDNQKFSYKRIVSTLSEMRSAPMSAQLDRLQTDAERWRGSNKQTDDITLMGFRYLS